MNTDEINNNKETLLEKSNEEILLEESKEDLLIAETKETPLIDKPEEKLLIDEPEDTPLIDKPSEQLLIENPEDKILKGDAFKIFYDSHEKENKKDELHLYIKNMFNKYGPRMCYDDNFYRENFYTKEKLPMTKIEKNIYRFKVDDLNLDDIIGAIDTTYWRSFERGIIFTTDGVFIKSDNQPIHIYYDKIKSISFNKPTIYITVYDENTKINDDIVIKDGSIWWTHKEFLYKFLLSIYNYINK